MLNRFNDTNTLLEIFKKVLPSHLYSVFRISVVICLNQWATSPHYQSRSDGSVRNPITSFLNDSLIELGVLYAV